MLFPITSIIQQKHGCVAPGLSGFFSLKFALLLFNSIEVQSKWSSWVEAVIREWKAKWIEEKVKGKEGEGGATGNIKRRYWEGIDVIYIEAEPRWSNDIDT